MFDDHWIHIAHVAGNSFAVLIVIRNVILATLAFAQSARFKRIGDRTKEDIADSVLVRYTLWAAAGLVVYVYSLAWLLYTA